MNYAKGVLLLAGLFSGIGTLWGQGAGSIDVLRAQLVPIYETLSFLGRVVPEQSFKHMSNISGYVQEVNVTSGQRVREGDLLFSVLTDQEIGLRSHLPQKVYARSSGIVISNELFRGAHVQAFSQGIEVATDGRWVIRTFASDKDLAYLRLRQPVSLFMGKDLKGEGTVSQIDSLMDDTVKLFPITFALSRKDSFYLGALVEVKVQIKRGDAVLIPRFSLQRRFNRAYVWKVVGAEEDGDIFQMVPIELGDLYNNQQILLEGLKEGDFFAQRANNRNLRENIPLKTKLVE
jgi:multidrug efflux pump subunit AcrA (membrane-fusion protein)